MEREMVEIKANLVDEIKKSSFERNNNEVTVANFSLVKKYGSGKEYINCAYYNDDLEFISDINKGDLIYVYGYFNIRKKDDKEYKNFVVKSMSKIENKRKESEV